MYLCGLLYITIVMKMRRVKNKLIKIVHPHQSARLMAELQRDDNGGVMGIEGVTSGEWRKIRNIEANGRCKAMYSVVSECYNTNHNTYDNTKHYTKDLL